MQIHQITRKTPNKKSMAVGRGGKRGKTAGRGTKGQKARAGRKIRPELRDVIKRIPKMRGRGKNSNVSIYSKPQVVNLTDIEAVFNTGETVNAESLKSKKLIARHAPLGKNVKILGTGEISKKLTFVGLHLSTSAKEKIEKSGGTIS